MTWEGVRLGDLAHFVRGVTFKPDAKVEVGSEGSVVCFRTSNVQSHLDQDDLIAVPKSVVKRAEQFVRTADLLVSSANSWNLVGKACWVPDLTYEATLGGFISALRVHSPRLDPRYLFHWFTSPKVQDTVRSFGRQTTNISNLDFERTLNLEIPLSPLPVQQRIAAVLDEVDVLRQKRGRNIEELERSKTRCVENFAAKFRDSSVTLENLITVGPNNGLYRPASDYGSGTLIIRIDAFYDGVVTGLSTLKRVNIPNDVKRRFSAKPRSILINRVNSREYLGKSAIVPVHNEDLVFESNMMRFEVDESRVLPEYLIECMQLPDFKRQILQRCKDAVNQSSINQQDVKSFSVPLATLEEQRRLAETVSEFNHLLSLMQRQQALTAELLSSLQARAFSGELDLRELSLS